MEKFRTFVKEHHALYLLFFPINFVIFFTSEKLALGRAFIIHCTLDEMIPFSDFFVVFYVIWYPLWIGMLLYCFIWEPESFRRMMFYFMLTLSISNVFYLTLPTMIDFQAADFQPTTPLKWVMNLLYLADEPTNVCPSEHVLGAFAVFFAALDTKRFRKPVWSITALFLAVMISLSIMFTKQHSFIDLIATLPLCFAAWILCFRPFGRKAKNTPDADASPAE